MWIRNKQTGNEFYVTDEATKKRIKGSNDYEEVKKESPKKKK